MKARRHSTRPRIPKSRRVKPERVGVQVEAKKEDEPSDLLFCAQDVLLSKGVEFLLSADLPRKEMANKLRDLAHRVETGCSVAALGLDVQSLIIRIASVTHDWTRQPENTGSDGEPKILPLRGRHSLAALISARFPRRQVLEIVHWMCEQRVIQVLSDGRYQLLNRTVILADRDPLTLAWIATNASQYLTTAIENWKARNPTTRQVDRISRVFNLPEKDVSHFREFAKSRAANCLEEIDNWLEDRDAPSGKRRRVEAGVHVYGYVGSMDSVTSRRLTCSTST